MEEDVDLVPYMCMQVELQEEVTLLNTQLYLSQICQFTLNLKSSCIEGAQVALNEVHLKLHLMQVTHQFVKLHTKSKYLKWNFIYFCGVTHTLRDEWVHQISDE